MARGTIGMGRRTRIVGAFGALVAVILLILLLFHEPIEEGRCKLKRRKADPESQLIGLAVEFVTPIDDKPDRVRDFSSGFEQPRYYEIKSGDRPALMAADYSRKLARLCAYTYSDGILSEKRCYTARVSEETPASGRRQQVGPVSLVSAYNASKTDDAFCINCLRENARGLLIPFPAFYPTGRKQGWKRP
jgi:hypothetical protein